MTKGKSIETGRLTKAAGRITRVVAGAACVALGAQSADAAEPKNEWHFGVGAGAVAYPKYPGSKSATASLLPFVNATYGRFFVGGDLSGAGIGGVGVNFYQDSGWRVGAALAPDLTRRKESDDERLRGLGDVDATIRAAVFANYTGNRIIVTGTVASDISGNHQGTLGHFDVRLRFQPSEALTIVAGPGLTWANSEYMRTFFGVDAQQSAQSGLPQFDAKSGLNSARFAVGARYQFDVHWSAIGVFSESWLLGDAADSPVTVSKSQSVVGAFAVYSF